MRRALFSVGFKCKMYTKCKDHMVYSGIPIGDVPRAVNDPLICAADSVLRCKDRCGAVIRWGDYVGAVFWRSDVHRLDGFQINVDHHI